MKLYFNGCSHTYGDDLDSPSSQSWPALVAKEYNCQFTNYAVSGGTNDQILYQTIKHINDFDKFYIAWTYTSRFTRYRSDNNHNVNFNIHLKNSLYGNNPEFLQYGKLHYTVWFNELYAFKLWLQNIILLQRFFESEKKSYVMINSTNNHIERWSAAWPHFNDSVKSLLCFDLMNDQQLFSEHLEIQQLIGQINQEHYIGWNAWWLTILISQYPVGPTGHLLDEGHASTAKYILEHDTN